MDKDNSHHDGSQQMTVKYQDENFSCKIIGGDTFITETLDNMFNEQGAAKRLSDILAGVEVPPVIQTKLDEIFSKIKANTKKVSDNLEANKE